MSRHLKLTCSSCLVVSLFAVLSPQSVSLSSSATNLVAITGATLIDGSGRPPIKDSVVIIDGDLIEAVGKPGRITIPASAQVIDASGLALAPGFIDAHSHADHGLDSDPSAKTQV